MKVRIVVLCVLATAPALAQPAKLAAPPEDSFEHNLGALFVNTGLTADQAARRAGKVSPTVRRRIAEVDAAIAQGEAAELARVPQLGGKLAYTRLSPLDPISFGPGAPPFVFLQNSYVAEATLAVPLSDYVFRIPKLVDAAHLAEDAARTSKQSSEVNAGQEARLSYYEWVRAKLQVLVAERQLLQVQSTLKQVRALAEAQRLSRADLLRVESNEAQAEQALDALTNLAQLREEQLRLFIGAQREEQLTIGEDIRADVATPAAAALDDLLGRATAKRLDFRVLDKAIAAKQKQLESEDANKLPRLTALAIADYANPNPRVFPQQDKFTFTWQVGAQLTWTLNDALVSNTSDRRLRAETDELRADRENLLRGTRIEVLAAGQAVQVALHSLQSSQKGLIAAEEGYRVRRELLNAERATAVELVDAETDLTRARIVALNARVDLRVALAQLTHAIGDDAAAHVP